MVIESCPWETDNQQQELINISKQTMYFFMALVFPLHANLDPNKNKIMAEFHWKKFQWFSIGKRILFMKWEKVFLDI